MYILKKLQGDLPNISSDDLWGIGKRRIGNCLDCFFFSFKQENLLHTKNIKGYLYVNT